MSQSDGYSTDDGKRKREVHDEKESIAKSQKMHKSPAISQQNEEKLDQILNLLQNLTLEVNQIRAEQREFQTELIELKAENKIIIKENANLKKDYEEMKKELRNTNTRLDQLEREKRRNNVVITGLKIENNKPENLKRKIKDFMQQKLGIEVAIKTAYKLGPQQCLVQVDNSVDKLKIMQSKIKLKNIEESRVFINNDLSKKERDIDKEIRNIAQEERKKERTVRIGYQKLIIEEEYRKICTRGKN
ncbi:hypothetical protein RN001_016129 [Aquatica leii]|uniref:Uncharacterized protein n=1 Tax=Aquatica leii TaxID=1421715 RepID=A0AAN7NU29_9COLE|nr:hypothetical protein RN001_016129 [Aquatica leii]